MLWKLSTVLVLGLAAGLLGCTNANVAPAGQLRPVAVRPTSPLETTEFAGQDLIGFDVYRDGATVHALFATATDMRKQPFIGYLRSDDGGRHWSSPSSIGQYAAATVESAAGNDIQIAAQGGMLMAVWQVTGEIPGMGPLQVLSSLDGGGTWTVGANPVQNAVDQSHPDLVADAQGRFHLVWLDDRDENGFQGIRYARSIDAGRHWQAAQTVDESTCSCCWNRLLPNGNGELYALYRDMEPRDMALAKSSNAGESWQRIASVGEFNWKFDGCPHNGGALAQDGNQVLHALVWTGVESRAGLYYLQSADAGKTWSPPRSMGNGGLAFHSDIAASGARHVVAIWDARGAEGSVVMISESFDAGVNWSPAQPISAPGASASFPRLLATASGYLAMWLEQKPGGAKQWMSALIE